MYSVKIRQFSKLIATIVLCLSLKSLYSQKSTVDCRIILNQSFKLLEEGDTISALRLYESLNESICEFQKGIYDHFSKIYYTQGLIEKSKEQFEKAIEHGLWGGIYFSDLNYEKLEKKTQERYSNEFFRQMKSKNEKIIQEKIVKYGDLVKKINGIYERDQVCRKDKKYKECRTYYFRSIWNYPVDSTKNHDEMFACAKEFLIRDSLIFDEFVSIVDSIGYVPGYDMVFKMAPVIPIIFHTSHYKYPNLDQLYLASVKRGTISPETYAVYVGYHEEYYNEPFTFYFTGSPDAFKEMTKEEIKKINQERLKIGLPLCPAVMLNTKIY